jgi:hypothetical protein
MMRLSNASEWEVSRMDDTKRAWDEVGEGFVNLRRIISERYRDLGEERGSRTTTPEEGRTADAIRRATDELDRAFTSLGDTLRDDDAREQMRDTGRKLSDALKVTFAEVGDEVRRAVGSRRSRGPSESRPSAPPTDPPADSGSSA